MVHAWKYRTEDKLKIQTIHKLNTTQKMDWIVHGFTSPPTQNRLYGRRVFTSQKTQPTVSKYWRKIYKGKQPREQRKYKIHICIHIQNSRQIKDTRISTANPLVYNNMGWLGDSSHRGQVARPEQWWGCRHGTPHNPEKAKQNYPDLVDFYDNRPGNEVGILHNVTEPTQGRAVKLWGHGGQ